MAYNNSDEIFISMHADDKEAFYAKIPYDKLPNIHRIGGKWMQSGKEWRFPLDDQIWEKFQKEFASEFATGKVHKDVAFLIAFDKRRKDLDKFLKFKEVAMRDEPTEFGVDGVSLNGKNCLFNYQRWGVQCGLTVGDGFLIGDSMGLGKAEVVDNRLFTPTGRKRIGDVSIGDEVIGSSGMPCKITGVFPQGNKPVYRITFSDGYSIECADEHLWTVFTTLGDTPVTLTVNDMLDEHKKIKHNVVGHNSGKEYEYKTYYKNPNGDSHWQIPLVQPIQFTRNEQLPIEPYLFGALLGDGHFMKHQVDVTENKDDFDEMFGGYIKNRYLNAHEKNSSSKSNARVVTFEAGDVMTSLGLGCKKSWEKFIPDCYKYASVENRLELLHGLMDTDGHCQKRSKNRTNKNNFVATEYCSTSEQLVDDVAELVQTLGGIARKHSKKTFYTKNGERHYCRTAYRLNIKLPAGMNPFKLKRKADACKTPLKYHVARAIRNIEYVGEKECVCIMVDAPNHLYVTEHCIVTHNTIQGLGIAKERMNRGEVRNCLIVCPASLKYNWRDEISKFLNMDALVIGHKCKNAQDREKQWIATGYPFKIVNYETVARDLYADPKKKDNRISCAKAVLGSFDMVVFDECFSYYSRVMLEDGSLEYIGKIVTHRLPVRVMSYNWETRQFEAKPVVNYFNNGRKPLLQLKTQYGTVQVTENHKYYRMDGTSVLAGELKPGDRIAIYNKFGFSNEILPLLAGTLLGDGSIVKNRENNLARYHSTHGMRQKEYACFKEMLFGHCNGKETRNDYENGFGNMLYGSRSKSMFPKHVYDIFYKDGKKKVTQEWLDLLNEFGLALWYMDDGSIQQLQYHKNNIQKLIDNFDYICEHENEYRMCVDKKSCASYYKKKFGLKNIECDKYFRKMMASEDMMAYLKSELNTISHVAFLHTEGFSKEEVELMSNHLKARFGLDNSIVKTKNKHREGEFYYHIRFTIDGTKKLIDIVSPYVIDNMRYKLGGMGRQYDDECVKSSIKSNGLFETEVMSIEPWNNRCNCTYNIEVEGNHNYICGGSLVSNCHMLKHHSSQRTLACRQFNAKYRVGLTGTPLDGRLEEIHSIFQILKPGLFVSKQKFMERYAEYDYFGAVKGYHHIKEVSDKIAPYYLRRLKEEVLKDLPPKIHKDMMVELSPKNMKAYKDLVKKKNEITENASAMELVMRARQFLDFPEILGLHNSSDKYAVFKELLDELVKENNHKVIIFSQYTNTLHWLMKNLESEYKNILVIDGSVDPEERQEICKKFNSDQKYRILIGSNAMSTGLNLQAADDVINYTADFSPAIMKQREDRAYRCGVTHTVTVYDFVCMDTVDERVRNILTKKQTVNNALLGENVDSFEVGDMSAMEILSCL